MTFMFQVINVTAAAVVLGWVGSQGLVCRLDFNSCEDLYCQLWFAISAHFLHSSERNMRQLGAVCLNQAHKEEAAIVLG